MKRRRYWQQQSAFGALAFEPFAGLIDRCAAAGNHGLGRVIEIHRLDDLAAVGGECLAHLEAAGYDALRLHAEDGCHRAHTHRHRILHRLRTQTHQRHSLRQCQHARRHQSGIFTQGMPGNGRRRLPDLVHPHAVSGHTGHQHHRLGVGGQA